jgi:hypothetical protein
MLSKADDYPIHQTPDPIAFSGTDRNFYDRYFFNGYTTDGDVFFAAALGVYPHLNIMDAGFAVRIGDKQYNLHASRHLHMERMDTQVGPIRVEVIEPLKVLRVVVDDNEHGISADITITGRHAPIEEPRSTRRNGPRIVQDVTRMTQLGRWSGWIKAAGQTVTLDEATTLGTRDRSWGVRHIGLRDPQVPVVAQEFQVWWVWLPAHLEDRIVHFFVNQDGDGKVWNLGAMMVHDEGSRIEHLHGAWMDMEYILGTRYPANAVVTATDEAGGSYRFEITPRARFYLSGIGYMNPEWSHGLNKGPLTIGYDESASNAGAKHGPGTEHAQSTSSVTLTLPDGKVLSGHGCFESLVLGRHSPSGLTSMFDVP